MPRRPEPLYPFPADLPKGLELAPEKEMSFEAVRPCNRELEDEFATRPLSNLSCSIWTEAEYEGWEPWF